MPPSVSQRDLSYQELLTKHGLTAEDGPALAQLFRNKLEVGDLCHSDISPGNRAKCSNFMELEVGFANDQGGSLAVFDRLMADFNFRMSGGLARVFKLHTEEDYARFMARIHVLLLLGWHARWHTPAYQQ